MCFSINIIDVHFPKPDLPSQGFTEQEATIAAVRTYNTGIESAITWLTEQNPDGKSYDLHDAHNTTHVRPFLVLSLWCTAFSG